MTEAEWLKVYMNPYYQEDTDTELLTAFIEKYTHASLSASKMWAMLAGKLAGEAEIKKTTNGAESYEFTSAQQQYTNAMSQSSYYKDLYDSETNNSSIAIAVNPNSVAGGIKSDGEYLDEYIESGT